MDTATTHVLVETNAEVGTSAGGMPQLDPTSYPSQLFWLTVTFLMLYVVLARFILPRIYHVLETRQERITHDLDRAESFKEEAQEARKSYEAALAEARNNAGRLVAEVSQTIKNTADEKNAELDLVIAKKVADSEASIADARRKVKATLAPVATELTGLIVETLINHKPSTEQINNAIAGAAQDKAA